ncbi:hypothetical protein KIH86_13330 [Paenibacillus sp. HN-1]|uniref:DUF6612 family protein n=1 Tax=Paenibacillus TaxID=44249 RepID=UPI001CA8DA17|nr:MULTISPECIES: DUF6612 family protein [Paenibacillus]MBY9080798.1 hypothetical protein [Paenibacillus sp. CGMCC 1.18879]MBY9085210.1 hypothetical protein [Paenibacillus sinensis]
MRNNWRTLGKFLIAGAVLVSGSIGWTSHPVTVSAAANNKVITADQMLAKLATTSKTLKNFHLSSTKKQDLQIGSMRIGNTNTLNLDINRLPSFAAAGSVNIGFLGTDFELYANDKEYYKVVDGSDLIDEYDEDTASGDVYGDSANGEAVNSADEIDPDSQYWVGLDQEDWYSLYTKGQFDPASVLDSVKAYKKSMKVSTAGTQTILQFTLTDAKAAKAVISLYDRENLYEGAVIQPKSVTWKLYANSKTWQTERLTVDLNYTLVEDGEKDVYTTKIDAKYSAHNKVATIVKPSELE